MPPLQPKLWKTKILESTNSCKKQSPRKEKQKITDLSTAILELLLIPLERTLKSQSKAAKSIMYVELQFPYATSSVIQFPWTHGNLHGKFMAIGHLMFICGLEVYSDNVICCHKTNSLLEVSTAYLRNYLSISEVSRHISTCWKNLGRGPPIPVKFRIWTD